jgi:hypothetical protein
MLVNIIQVIQTVTPIKLIRLCISRLRVRLKIAKSPIDWEIVNRPYFTEKHQLHQTRLKK